MSKWVALSEGQGGTIGWLTTNERKEAMWCAAAQLRHRLFRLHTLVCARFQFRDALRVGNIFLSNEFFSVLLDEREALKQMRDELCRFAIVTEPAKTTFGKGAAYHGIAMKLP